MFLKEHIYRQPEKVIIAAVHCSQAFVVISFWCYVHEPWQVGYTDISTDEGQQQQPAQGPRIACLLHQQNL